MKRTATLVLVMLCRAANTQNAWQYLNLTSIPPAETAVLGTSSGHGIHFYTNGEERFEITNTGAIKFNNLTSTLGRMLQVDATGVLGAAPLHFTNGYLNLCQNTKFAINVPSPLANLDVGGSTRMTSNLGVGGKVYVGGNNNDFGGISYTPGTPTTPSVFRITAGGSNNGEPGQNFDGPGENQDPDPTDLLCAGKTNSLASMVYMQNRLVIAHKANTLSLGLIEIGHDGTNGVIDTRGIGTNSQNPASDLVINGTCGRNVYVFGGSTFENAANSVMSVKGRLNVTGNMQLGSIPGTSFIDPNVRFFIDGGASNGLKLRHTGTATQFAICAVASNNSNLFTVFGDGLLEIAASGQSALSIKDKNQNNVERFTVFRDGSTVIGENLSSPVNSKLTIGTSSSHSKAISVIDNTIPSNLQTRFAAFANGKVQITTIDATALSIQNANDNNRETFIVKDNGYTEIRVYSPLGMPVPPGATDARVLTIKDMSGNNNSGKDLFVVRHDGKVYAREIEVSLVATFPDYVFKEGYQLPSISDVKSFINKNGHLPGFKPACFYESNGLQVGELILKQQEKIEELTLYIIALKDRIDEIDTNLHIKK